MRQSKCTSTAPSDSTAKTTFMVGAIGWSPETPTFIYRDVIDGEEILLPNLQYQIERTWPGHQRFIADLLTAVTGDAKWRVVFCPSRTKRGKGMVSLYKKWLFLTYGRRKEMMITCYHEMLHILLPQTMGLSKRLHRGQWQRAEKKVEMLAKRWYTSGICSLKPLNNYQNIRERDENFSTLRLPDSQSRRDIDANYVG